MEYLLGEVHVVHVRRREVLQSADREMGYFDGGGYDHDVHWNLCL